MTSGRNWLASHSDAGIDSPLRQTELVSLGAAKFRLEAIADHVAVRSRRPYRQDRKSF